MQGDHKKERRRYDYKSDDSEMAEEYSMKKVHFDEEQLKQRLQGLQPAARTALAAACAERLRAAYVSFAIRRRRKTDAAEFEAVLDRVWSDAMGESMSPREVGDALKKVMRLIPDEDEGTWEDAQAPADDAGAALGYALRYLKTGESQEVAWAARRAYEAADYWVTHAGGVDVNGPEGEKRALHHPVVQAELKRQEADLEELESADASSIGKVIARIRERARKDASQTGKR